MNGLLYKARTAFALGIPNLVRVATYRLGVGVGLNPVRRISAQFPTTSQFFDASSVGLNDQPKSTSLKNTYFGWFQFSAQGYPKWHENPFNNRYFNVASRDWWEIGDFDNSVGDIKTVWEASRFSWAPSFARLALSGETSPLRELNDWISDWSEKNPAYKGPNWKCGQEASIRVLQLAMCALVLEQHDNPTSSLMMLVEAHLRRIAPTIQYAIAQDNNHGTSEAAALFIGGSWLERVGSPGAKKWSKLGRKWLENRANRLIEQDGSFSQYSVNYHRLMLDTFNLAEVWRIANQLESFNDNTYSQLRKATNWLYQMIDPTTGDAPNMGANDGANLLQGLGVEYRDFRPSVQLATSLFMNENAYGVPGTWNEPARLLAVTIAGAQREPRHSCFFANGGYTTLVQSDCFVLFRFPRFRFRPSQADALHVDLWWKGQNLLRDGGTYSYNDTPETASYFGGTQSHNTIQFDDRDQMPRLSRFLFGAWLKSEATGVEDTGDEVLTSARYTDYQGATHERKITLGDKEMVIDDCFDGFEKKAVLRWRLIPSNWSVNQSVAQSDAFKIEIETSIDIVRFEIVEGWESKYYMKKDPIPVLEVEVAKPGEIATHIQFAS